MKKIVTIFFVMFVLIIVAFGQNALFDMDIKNATITGYFIGGNEYTKAYKDSDFSEFREAYSVRIDAPYSDKNIDNIKKTLSLKIIFSEQVGSIDIYYFYSYKLSKIQYHQMQKYNIMIAITRQKLIVGYPIIAGSY